MRNCLTFALSMWRYWNSKSHLVIRKSHHGWFPHFAIIDEDSSGDLVKIEYLPKKPRDTKKIPPLFFDGLVRISKYKLIETEDLVA